VGRERRVGVSGALCSQTCLNALPSNQARMPPNARCASGSTSGGLIRWWVLEESNEWQTPARSAAGATVTRQLALQSRTGCHGGGGRSFSLVKSGGSAKNASSPARAYGHG
jgi:hypothetical protein